MARTLASHWKRSLAAAIGVLVLPLSLPYWWNPSTMDTYFTASLPPLSDALREPTDYLRRQTPRDAAVLSDGDFARYAAALGARRVLAADAFHQPKDVLRRFAVQDAVLTDDTGAVLRDLDEYGQRWGVSEWYAAVTPRWLAALGTGLTLDDVRRRAHLEPVHFWGDERGEFVAIFKVRR